MKALVRQAHAADRRTVGLARRPDGNIQHIAEHGLLPADVEHVLNHPIKRSKSRSSGLPLVIGDTPSGEPVAVIFEEIDEHTVYPVTAYQIEE